MISSPERLRWMPRSIGALALCLAGAACGDRDAGAEEEARTTYAENTTPGTAVGDRSVVGTISARFDGEERTWYVVRGELEGEPHATGMWMSLEDGERMATLGGFDSPDVPVETFRSDFEAGEVTYGDYRGSVFTIGFPFGAGDTQIADRFPDGDAAVIYLPDVEGGNVDYSGMYMLDEGSLEVDVIDARRDGPSEFAGTFQGTLTRLDRSESIEVTDGRFEVTGATYVEQPAESEGDARGASGAGATGQSMPEDFPTSIPLPERYDLIASATGAAAEINVTLHTPAALDELKELYDRGLPEGGWEVTHRRESEFGDARSIHYGITRGEESGIVQLIDDPERALRVLGIALGDR